MNESQIDHVRVRLLKLLDNGDAHMGFEPAVADYPMEAINQHPPNTPFTPWHILEHMRFAQREILDMIQAETFVKPSWPDDFWPATDATADEASWQATIDDFRADLDALRAIVNDPASDFFAPVRHHESRTLMDLMCNVAAHNHHHIGEFIVLRQVMNTWPPDREMAGT